MSYKANEWFLKISKISIVISFVIGIELAHLFGNRLYT